MLLADAVQRGEMAVEDPLSKYLTELAGSPARDVTLFELATHSSGLPPIAPPAPDRCWPCASSTRTCDVSVAG